MFFGDKSKIGSLPGTEKVLGEPVDEYEEMLKIASEEILGAIEANDPEMFKMGLKSFIEICQNHEEKSEEEDY